MHNCNPSARIIGGVWPALVVCQVPLLVAGTKQRQLAATIHFILNKGGGGERGATTLGWLGRLTTNRLLISSLDFATCLLIGRWPGQVDPDDLRAHPFL